MEFKGSFPTRGNSKYPSSLSITASFKMQSCPCISHVTLSDVKRHWQYTFTTPKRLYVVLHEGEIYCISPYIIRKLLIQKCFKCAFVLDNFETFCHSAWILLVFHPDSFLPGEFKYALLKLVYNKRSGLTNFLNVSRTFHSKHISRYLT